jgi:hypothetical protein
MDGTASYHTLHPRRNPLSPPPVLERPSPELRRLLGDVPCLVIDHDRARSWLGAGIVPPTLIIERGQEAVALSSAALARLLRLCVPVLVRLADWRQVTRWAGHALDRPDGERATA